MQLLPHPHALFIPSWREGTGMNQTDPWWIWSPISSGWSPPGLLKALARVTSGRLIVWVPLWPSRTDCFSQCCQLPQKKHHEQVWRESRPIIFWKTFLENFLRGLLVEDFFRRLSARQSKLGRQSLMRLQVRQSLLTVSARQSLMRVFEDTLQRKSLMTAFWWAVI